MGSLHAHGITARLPSGFEGQIFQRRSAYGAVAKPVAQFATFALPSAVGDFGGGAVDRMGPSDIFAVLFEYGSESLGTALFARQGLPRRLGPGDFRPFTLRRGLPGQSGTQWFFTEAGRPFTLYAVLGSHAQRARLLPQLNGLLSTIEVQLASTVPASTPSTSAGAPT